MATNGETAGPVPARNPSTKLAGAWSKGSPITGRPAGALNGVANPSRPTQSPVNSNASRNAATIDTQAHDRMIFILANLTGLPCNLHLTTGESFTGIFSAAVFESPEPCVIFKMVKQSGPSSDNASYVGQGKDHSMIFTWSSVANIAASNVRFDSLAAKATNGVASQFRTDTDISGNSSRGERTLTKWQGPMDTSVDMSLGSDNSIGGWDQFKDNEKKFGLKSDYDETFYTTALDKSHPDYKRREANAIRVAREIEGSTASNVHIAEERGLKYDDSGLDEESKYSGVARSGDATPLASGQPNRYMPPARRPPTGQPTVSGAPVDDAIISATLAKQPPAQKQTQAEVPIASKPIDAAPAPASTNVVPTVQPTIAPTENQAPAKVAQPNATATVEKDVVAAFKTFSQTEKLRALEQQRKAVRHDKAVKLNDLKKFAENFKLNTPVPSDLIPILAKDKVKQQAIQARNEQSVNEKDTTPPRQPSLSATSSADKAVRPVAGQRPAESAAPQPAATLDKASAARSRPGQPIPSQSVRAERPFQGQQASGVPTRQGPGPQHPATQRLTLSHLPARPAPPSVAGLYQDTRASPAGHSPASGGPLSPTNSLRFNVKAMEFRPNPGASSFQPVQPASDRSSPAKDASRRPSVRKPPQGNFWEGRRPKIEKANRIDLDDFNPVQRMKKEATAEGKAKDYQINQGIPQAYRTAPVWDPSDANKEKTYMQVFEQTQAQPPMPMPHMQQPMPHHQQIPMHMQQGRHPQHYGQHGPRHMPGQSVHQGMTNHFEDHQSRFSQSQSSVQPSPRVQPGFVYPGQGNQPVQMYANGAIPYMTPGGHPMGSRQVSSSGPQYGMPMQAMGGHMMTNSPSHGPYANAQMTPQPQAYPVPAAVYSQHGGVGGPMQAQNMMVNGFASPRMVPAPMMARQGSQQGIPMGYMQPHMQYVAPGVQAPMTPLRNGMSAQSTPYMQNMQYTGSPHQQQYQMQHGSHRGTPSMSHAQPMMPHHVMAMSQGMVTSPNMASGPAGSDAREEAK